MTTSVSRSMCSGPWGEVVVGDCLKVLPALPDQLVDLVLTDPPYAINYRSNRRTARPRFDWLTGDQPGDWIERLAAEAYRILKPDRHLYCFCRFDTYPRFFGAFQDVGFTMKRTLIWVKNNHGSGDLRGDYAPKDEWIIFAQKGRRPLNGRRSFNVLNYNKVPSAELMHPTQKPVELLKFLIAKSTVLGETVLDPFAGVLTTAIAAVQTGRKVLAVEVEPAFVTAGLPSLMAAVEAAPRLVRRRPPAPVQT